MPDLIKTIATGFLGLTQSKKGTLCLLVLAVSAILAAYGKLDGMAWAASCTLISGVYCFTQSRIDASYVTQNVTQAVQGQISAQKSVIQG